MVLCISSLLRLFSPTHLPSVLVFCHLGRPKFHSFPSIVDFGYYIAVKELLFVFIIFVFGSVRSCTEPNLRPTHRIGVPYAPSFRFITNWWLGCDCVCVSAACVCVCVWEQFQWNDSTPNSIVCMFCGVYKSNSLSPTSIKRQFRFFPPSPFLFALKCQLVVQNASGKNSTELVEMNGGVCLLVVDNRH